MGRLCQTWLAVGDQDASNAAMTTARVQSYANHRTAPLVTVLAGGVLVGEFFHQAWMAVHGPNWSATWLALVFAALLVVWSNSRNKAMKIQDRIIRLEMQDRLRRLLPADKHADISRLELRHVIALRFAGDGELPGLVQEVVAGTLTSPDAIKRRVTDWQADWLRV